ncbi:Gfo/Idh/MocA family protein [Antarcticirhabdus aurantiaca]|uniref:Gfo/Idh/MocA family oxidoreductase n=1 Tax=Antarcticirhabdus aurantiaca TaxID=2606717 RepID=A0ACD4NKD8_9HYPH|nr:Gfo/Idh/MocA family oxidoreductase [Antarcticirhabdus aurantiaca]WAJ27333.1 Gfo/Idh/MocA family oxidoreductase [Jeongeuplla avenae]
MTALRFAAVGLNHNHIYGQVDCLLREGAELVGFVSPEDDLAAEFAAKYPQAPRLDDRRRVLEDDSIELIVSAAVPADRAGIAVEAMRAGKDVMLDKPGMTTFAQLDELRRVQAETGRILSILYSEHFENRATVRAGELVKSGAIGRVVSTAGFGPHRMRKEQRPGWFFERERYGGILVDIASHQCEQFLFFTGETKAEVLSARVFNRAHPDRPGLQDTGDIHLATAEATGFVRVDWFTPDGLPVWGDGRLFITGTEGMIELRKYVDIAGRPGTDHLFLTDAKGVRHFDCSDGDLPYARQLIADIRNRTQTAMPQDRCFAAMELALTAQALAEGAHA